MRPMWRLIWENIYLTRFNRRRYLNNEMRWDNAESVGCDLRRRSVWIRKGRIEFDMQMLNLVESFDKELNTRGVSNPIIIWSPIEDNTRWRVLWERRRKGKGASIKRWWEGLHIFHPRRCSIQDETTFLLLLLTFVSHICHHRKSSSYFCFSSDSLSDGYLMTTRLLPGMNVIYAKCIEFPIAPRRKWSLIFP